MKNIVALIVALLFPLNLLAVDITYQVNSGGKTSSLTNSYDMSAGSTASSDINLTANPSISSHTNIHAVGPENNIEVTTSSHDGSASSSASVRIIDNVSSADISTSASAANSTSASVTATGTGVQAGLIKGESGGNKTFCAFTGDFNASSDAANGGVSVSSTYENFLSNIYIVTKNPTTTHCPGAATTYKDIIQDGVDAATNDSGKPDYVFVDYGNYAGAAMEGKNSLTLMGVWGADNTVVQGSGGDVISASGSTNLTIEGFTVTGGSSPSTNSKDGEVKKTSPLGTGSGIGIYNSSGAIRVRDNTAIENDGAGIFVGSIPEEINLESTIKDIGDLGPTEETVNVKGNTVHNGEIGIVVLSGGDVNVSCNTVTGSDVSDDEDPVLAGIAAVSLSGDVNVSQNKVSNGGYVGVVAGAKGNATVTGNEVTNSELAGIVGVSVSGNVNVSDNKVTNGGYVGLGAVAINGNAIVTGNKVSGSDLAGIAVGSSGNANVSGNTVNGGLVGIGALSGGESNVNNNKVSDTDLAGIAVGSRGNANISGNTVTNGGLIGMLALSANDANVTGNNVSNSDFAGIAVGSSGNANVSGNTVTNGGLLGIGVLSNGNVDLKGNTVSENDVGIYIGGFSGTAHVNQNNIYSNNTGLFNDSGKTVDATNNWWGRGGTGGPGQGGNNGVVDSGVGSSTITTPWSHVRF
jgi:parallel beta-helix repeat protein